MEVICINNSRLAVKWCLCGITSSNFNDLLLNSPHFKFLYFMYQKENDLKLYIFSNEVMQKTLISVTYYSRG